MPKLGDGVPPVAESVAVAVSECDSDGVASERGVERVTDDVGLMDADSERVIDEEWLSVPRVNVRVA